MALIGPDDNQMKLIQKEVNETDPKKVEENTRLIKEWLNCQPHLPRNYDERMIPSFLRGCKHDLEKTKRKLDMYFTVRATMPEFFTQRDAHNNEIKTVIKLVNAFPLPRLTPDGYRVTLHKVMDSNTASFEPCDIYKALCMIGDVRIVEERAIAGDIFIFDAGCVTLSHLTKLATPQLKKILHCTQEAYPQRLKEIHLVNCPSFIDKIVNVFKMFMKEKMRNRFHLHTGYRTLYNFIPQSILPEEYGGDAKSIDQLQAQWMKKLESYTEYFATQENIKADNSRRPIKTSVSVDENMFQFGTEGAFRKLNID